MDCMTRKVQLKVIPAKTGKKFLVNTQLDKRVHDLIELIETKTGLKDVILYPQNSAKFDRLQKSEDTTDLLLFNIFGKKMLDNSSE